MTNGEVLQKTFPNSELDTLSTKIVFTLEPRSLGQQVFVFDKDWWNAEYKELTTKNKAKYCDRNICLKNEYNNIGCEDCEVTKSQEPTAKNDLADEYISRKALMAILSDYYDTTVEYRSMLKEIAALPSVTPQEPRWIPVDERLPEIHNYSDYYLVTLKRGGVHIAIFTECGRESWWTSDDVIAWMPLPQEYREVEE